MMFWPFTICPLLLSMAQADYDIVFEDVDCTDVNEEYIKTCELELDYDSTYGSSVTSYMEVIKQLPDNIMVLGDLFTVRMGEYNVNIGLHIDGHFCEIARDPNSIAIPLLRALDMDTNDCPPQPGVYQRDGYVIDNTDGLPSSFPSGHYLLNLTIFTEDTTIVHFDVYIRVY